jgi:uncharacterized protein
MNLYDATVPVFTKQLHNVERWLDKLTAYAAAKKIEPEVLLASRLYPDQWPFLRQITAACDWTKYCTSKMAGKDSPSNPDTEKTVDELRARLRTAIEYLATFKPDDFLACEDRPCTHVWMQGKSVRAGDYLDHVALPNIHFHLTTAYAILRHNGVDLGKSDYLGEIPFRT